MTASIKVCSVDTGNGIIYLSITGGACMHYTHALVLIAELQNEIKKCERAEALRDEEMKAYSRKTILERK